MNQLSDPRGAWLLKNLNIAWGIQQLKAFNNTYGTWSIKVLLDIYYGALFTLEELRYAWNLLILGKVSSDAQFLL